MAWGYDEYGFPVYTYDPSDYGTDYRPYADPNTMYSGGTPYFDEGFGPTGQFGDPMGGYDPAMGDIYWDGINLEDPSMWAQYGLTEADFANYDPSVYGDFSQYAAGNFGETADAAYPTTVSNDQLNYLYNEGVRDFSGLDLTDEQMAAIRDAGLTTDTSGQTDAGSFWRNVLSGAGSLASGVGGLAAKFGGQLGDAAMKDPLSAAALGAGGVAALAAAFQDDPEKMPMPDFTAPAQLNPEQRNLLSYIQSQAAREGRLGEAAEPVQRGILENIQGQLPGLGQQATDEQTARDLALQNVTLGLQSPADPNRRNPDYEPFWQNALTAEGQIAGELASPMEASLMAQRQSEDLRRRYEDQQREALGTGYVTSTPYTQGKYGAGGLEAGINEYLQTDAETRRANRLAMLSGVSMPRAQQAEQTTGNLYNRELAGQQAQMQQYQGLNQTQDALGKLAATAQAVTPSGSAERGLSAVSGIRDQQQQLLNSIYQFNAGLQQQKNQNLWNFAGTALGGGLYGLKKSTA